MPRLLRPRRLVAALAASAVCASLSATLSAPTALASHGQTTYFDATGELLNPATRAHAFAQLQTLGVRALRLILSWHDVAPDPESARRPAFEATNPASYNWSSYDAVVAEANRLGWPVLMTVSSPVPKWATAAHRDLLTRPSDSDFREFMTAVGRHFGSEVSLWAIWNEPNQVGWLLPQFNRNGTPASPGIYRGLFEAGYAGLRAAGLANPRVLLGETAPFGESHVNARKNGTLHNVSPLAFLRGALCLNSRYHRVGHCQELHPYGYGHHAYPNAQGPSYAPPNHDQVTIGTLGRLVQALNRAAAAHAIPGGLRIYLTEFGINTTPNPLGVSAPKQAVEDAISEKIAWSNPRVAAFGQYELRDDAIPAHHSADWTGFQTGLETAAGVRKPLYSAFPVPLVVSRLRHGYSLWGLVRPATGATSLQVQVQPRAGRRFIALATAHTDASGYWSLRSSTHGVAWRVRWVSPTGVVYTGPPIPAS